MIIAGYDHLNGGMEDKGALVAVVSESLRIICIDAGGEGRVGSGWERRCYPST